MTPASEEVEFSKPHSVGRAARLAGLLTGLALLAPPAFGEVPAEGGTAEAVSEVPEPGGPEEGTAEAADGAPVKKRKRPVESIETGNLEDPAFPTARVRDAFRIRFQTRVMPAAAFDSFDADLYRPELRLRATLPVAKRAVLQLTGRMATSLYDFDVKGGFPGVAMSDPLTSFYDTSLTLQGGFRLNERKTLWYGGEMWSLLASARWRARWESGAFGESQTGAGAMALGYEIDDLIRVAIGFGVRSRVDKSGVRVAPVMTFKWDMTDRVTLRSRGRGLQLEYTFNKKFEVFATGFFDRDKYRLDARAGLPDDLSFRDQMVLTGMGFEWRLSKHFRINAEAGAAAWREIRVKSQQAGTLFKEQSRPSAYFDFRLEIRP